jgi:hypothetical protein
MKTFYQLQNEAVNLHNELAMKDAPSLDKEDTLDEACDKLTSVIQLLSHLDIDGKN